MLQSMTHPCPTRRSSFLAAEPVEIAVLVVLGRARKLPPAGLAMDRHAHQQIREVLPPLEPLGEIVKAAREMPAFPGRASDELEKRHARSEEHTPELQSLIRISYAVFCLTNKKKET